MKGIRDKVKEKIIRDGLDKESPREALDKRMGENVLEHANDLVNGDRQDVYGDPHTNHQRIADLWNAYLSGSPNEHITPTDAAVMMMLVKVGRLMHTSDHLDTWVDIAGYAQVGYWCANKAATKDAAGADWAAAGAATHWVKEYEEMIDE